jgi:hypothetical protein
LIFVGNLIFDGSLIFLSRFLRDSMYLFIG